MIDFEPSDIFSLNVILHRYYEESCNVNLHFKLDLYRHILTWEYLDKFEAREARHGIEGALQVNSFGLEGSFTLFKAHIRSPLL